MNFKTGVLALGIHECKGRNRLCIWLALAAVACLLAAFLCPMTTNAAEQYTLTINSTDGGSVWLPGEGTFTYNAGEVVRLEALVDSCLIVGHVVPSDMSDSSPRYRYQFDGFTSDACLDYNAVTLVDPPNGGGCSITMDADYTVTANFSVYSEMAPAPDLPNPDEDNGHALVDDDTGDSDRSGIAAWVWGVIGAAVVFFGIITLVLARRRVTG